LELNRTMRRCDFSASPNNLTANPLKQRSTVKQLAIVKQLRFVSRSFTNFGAQAGDAALRDVRQPRELASTPPTLNRRATPHRKATLNRKATLRCKATLNGKVTRSNLRAQAGDAALRDVRQPRECLQRAPPVRRLDSPLRPLCGAELLYCQEFFLTRDVCQPREWHAKAPGHTRLSMRTD
jgi:hypothetical protein